MLYEPKTGFKRGEKVRALKDGSFFTFPQGVLVPVGTVGTVSHGDYLPDGRVIVVARCKVASGFVFGKYRENFTVVSSWELHDLERVAEESETDHS